MLLYRRPIWQKDLALTAVCRAAICSSFFAPLEVNTRLLLKGENWFTLRYLYAHAVTSWSAL